MAKKVVVKNAISRKDGYMYYLDKSGNIIEMKRKSKSKKIIKKNAVTRREGFLYCLDSKGNILEITRSKGGRKKKKSKGKKTAKRKRR